MAQEYIKIPYQQSPPHFYGIYQGENLQGQLIIIDVDWKIKAYRSEIHPQNQIGTDQIAYWFCNKEHVLSLIHQLKD
jgi:hypothetical protein